MRGSWAPSRSIENRKGISQFGSRSEQVSVREAEKQLSALITRLLEIVTEVVEVGRGWVRCAESHVCRVSESGSGWREGAAWLPIVLSQSE
jgi:hypothetical protein